MNCKKRNMFLCVLFTMLTGGIYAMYWWCKVTTETNNLATKNKTANGFLALVLTVITSGVYSFYWAYKMGARVGEINNESSHSVLYLVLGFLGFAWLIPFFAQDAINKKVMASAQAAA